MVKHIEIVNKDGKTLRGYYDEPVNFNGDVVVMFHGFTGNKTEHACHFRNMSRILSENGIGSLRLDFSGNGESDGDFNDFTYDTALAEALQIVEYAEKLEGFKRLILLGFSMGGAFAAQIASMIKTRCHKLVLWSPAGNIDVLIRNCFEKSPKLENGNAQYGNFELSKEMYESCNRWHPFENLGDYENKVLIIHGRSDQSVPCLYSARYAVSFKNSHLYYIDGARHGYDAIEHREKLYNLTLEFLKTN